MDMKAIKYVLAGALVLSTALPVKAQDVKAQVDAITFSADFKKSIRESWNVWDIVGTLVVIGLCASFYAYFW
jgi:hypothetical protein